MGSALQMEGFDVTTATDGPAADAVILDVMMPYLDGLQVPRGAP